MAPDERDRSFDKALARHLRADGSLQDSASPSSRESARAGECPAPETLAAYHERTLFPEEMNSWKEHIVGCANCQTILSHLEATDAIPLQTMDEAKIPARGESAHQVAASSQRQPAVPAVVPKQSRRARLLRGARWQWLAPAGALAAGLLVWIALHEKQPPAPPNLKEEVQIATKQVAPPPPPSVSSAAQEKSPASNAVTAKPQSAADEFASERPRASKGAAKTDSKQEYLARVSPPKVPADKEGRLRKDADASASVDLLRAQEQLDRDGKTADNARQESAEVQLQAQASNAQLQNLQNQSNANAPKAPGPAPLGQTEGKKMRAGSASPAAPPPQSSVAGKIASSYNDSPSLQVARAIANPRLISSPGSNVVWRAGRSGLIEFSKDGGSSWSRQTSGVLVDLLTGSASSDQVCWIVGRAGAILLTTDGGAHWKVVPSPLAEDLGGVRATDALHATVWNARATKSFQTSDGGLTWAPVPSP